MALTANEYLAEILHVVGKIEQNQRSSVEEEGKKTPGTAPTTPTTTGSISTNIGDVLKSFVGVGRGMKNLFDFTEKLLDISKQASEVNVKKGKIIADSLSVISESLPNLASGLSELGKVRSRQVDKVIINLQRLYEFMYDVGNARKIRRVERGIKLFERISVSLRRIARPIRTISMSFIYIGLGIATFAGSIVLTASLLRLGKPGDVIPFLITTIIGIATVFTVLALARGFVDIGTGVIRNIGLGMAALALGIISFALTIAILPSILGGEGGRSIAGSLGIMVGIVGAATLMFMMLGLAHKWVNIGTLAIGGISVGMIALSLGIISFALTIALLPHILGRETGGSIWNSLLIMVGIVGAASLMFTMLGALAPKVGLGFLSILAISAGLAIFGFAVIGLAHAAKQLMGSKLGLGDDDGERDENKRMILRGFGTMGLILLASVATFALLTPAAPFILPGLAIFAAIAASLILFSVSVSKLVTSAKELEGRDIKGSIGGMISGVISGLIEGMSPLTGGQKGIMGAATFIKNSAKIFAGTTLLMAMSVSLSMFAKAISAFARLDSMRIIEGYDNEGRPIFGERVNISRVADNITYSISTFLSAIIESTDNLTRRQARAIHRMSRALVGRRGILTAVIQFSDALKVYSEFGEKGEIGYQTYDEDGNAITSHVPIKTVVDHMLNSFLYFTTEMFSRSEQQFGDGTPGPSWIQKRRMRRMARALTGRHGILGAIIDFANTLQTYSQFGAENKIGFQSYDDEGVATTSFVPVNTIVSNIIGSFTYFTDALFSQSKNEFGDGEPGLEGMSWRQRMRVRRMSKSLTGKHGILGSIVEFAETVQVFAKFGTQNAMPILDEEGKPTGKYLTIDRIARNIVSGLATFSSILADELDKGDTKEATKALSGYESMINQLSKLSESMDGLSRISASITELGQGIGLLGDNLNKLNTEKLAQAAEISAAYLAKTNAYSDSVRRITEGPSPIREAITSPGEATPHPVMSPTGTPAVTTAPVMSSAGTPAVTISTKEVNWDKVAIQIGNAVGQQVVNGLKAGQFKFEFSSPGSPEGIYYWEPK